MFVHSDDKQEVWGQSDPASQKDIDSQVSLILHTWSTHSELADRHGHVVVLQMIPSTCAVGLPPSCTAHMQANYACEEADVLCCGIA